MCVFLSKYQNMPSNYKLVSLVPCPLPSAVDFLGLSAPLFEARVSIGPTYSKSLKWLCPNSGLPGAFSSSIAEPREE